MHAMCAVSLLLVPSCRYAVNSQSSQVTLPSGTQEEDMWDALHAFLWEQTATSTKVISREQYERRREDGSVGEALVESPTADTPEGKERDGDASSEAKSGFVAVRMPMPDSYLHMYSLAFACFGPFSDHPDPDINISVSDGPPGACSKDAVDGNDTASNKAPTSSCLSSVEVGATPKTLRGRVYADEQLSRLAIKKQKREQKAKPETMALSARLMEVIERSSSNEVDSKAISAVQGVEMQLRLANDQRSRAHKTAEKDKQMEWASKEIQLLKDMGDPEGVKEAQQRLLALMKAPLLREEVAPPPVNQDSVNNPLVEEAHGSSGAPYSRSPSVALSSDGSTTAPVSGGGGSTGLRWSGTGSNSPPSTVMVELVAEAL